MKAIDVFDDARVPGDVFQQLFSATLGGPVCPRLKSLTWTTLHRWDNAQKFFSPHLVSVCFAERGERRPYTDPILTSTISLLPTTHLEGLHLLRLPSSPRIQSAVSEVVQRLNTCLRRLSTGPPLSDAAWEHLASLPRLKCLWVSNTPSTKTLRSAPYGITFPALEQAGITVDDPCQHWSFLFSLLRSSPL